MINTSNCTWTVNISGIGGNPHFDLTASNQFYLAVIPPYESGFFRSQAFNITDDTPHGPNAPFPATDEDTLTVTELSTGDRLGIAIGVAVFNVALLSGLIACVVRRRRYAGSMPISTSDQYH